MLRDIFSDCSDGEKSDDDMNDVENEVVQAAFSDEEFSDLDNDNALDSGATVSPNNVNTKAEEKDNKQIFWGKDGSFWQALAPNQAVSGRLQQQNITSIRPGPIAYVAPRIISDSSLLSFRIIFNELMPKNVQKVVLLKLSEL